MYRPVPFFDLFEKQVEKLEIEAGGYVCLFFSYGKKGEKKYSPLFLIENDPSAIVNPTSQLLKKGSFR